ncbi:M48 family metallopeptidase [Sphingomonas sp. CL5.1]|uniref:M48 family metallopeptidase n=1 Tax=Sphingomonas sp. CL5.1 TaxID=2653203 RepID=UPI0015830F89|nr:YgjP-like metallopeptidase domain-containing protein [Sphingomonas sp. CL5.1]QKR99132.1 M48 family metallopeptidase [Sphingomonas sp. CL5.1]
MTAGIEVVRHPRARRAKLSIDPASGRARLVIPQRASAKAALAWAATQGEWLDRQRAALPIAKPFVDGMTVPFDDAALVVTWNEAAPRRVLRDGDRLMLGGPRETIGRRVEAWLKREALRLLSEDTAHYAALAGVRVTKVAIGDARGRWGSCAASGTIRYNWRLALAPRAVRRATVAHEVAHRVHMNHGAAFHALVATLYGRDPLPERRWLRAHGAALHWYGRGSDE